MAVATKRPAIDTAVKPFTFKATDADLEDRLLAGEREDRAEGLQDRARVSAGRYQRGRQLQKLEAGGPVGPNRALERRSAVS